MEENKKLWRDVLESVRVSVSPAIFSTWFSQTHLVELSKQKKRHAVSVGCSSSFVKTTIEGRYFGLIQDALVSALGTPCDLVFLVKQDSSREGSAEDLAVPLFEEE